MKKQFIPFCIFCSSILSFSVQAQEKIILSEDFSNNSRNWEVFDDTLVKWKIENGKYYRQNFKKFSYASFKPVDINIDNSFSISLTTTHLSLVSNYGYGIVFGAKDTYNRFGFVITNSGQYMVYKMKASVMTELVKWTKTPVIKINTIKVGSDKNGKIILEEGDKNDNVLMIKKQGSDWKFYINDQFLTGIPAEPFFGYGFGLTSDGNQAVSFDNLVVKESNASMAMAVKEDILLLEDFSLNTRKWPETNDEYTKQKISNGKYTWDHFKGIDISFMHVSLNQRVDYSISLKAAHIKNKDDEYSAFGICFGFMDIKNFFGFFILSDGYYVLYKIENEKDTMLLKEAYSAAIKTGNNAVNDLKVKKEGSLWKLLVNDVMVATHPA
ncbi:MAG: hypothetical protein ACRDEB_02785, partial [Chitinophagaceae bacterium]